MKRILSFMLSIAIILSLFPCVFSYAQGSELIELFPQDGKDGTLYRIIEHNSKDVISFNERDAEKELITKFYLNKEDITPGTQPTISFLFDIPKDGNYHVWMKAYTLSNSGDSIWVALNNEDYKQVSLVVTGKDDCTWVKLDSSYLKKGEHNLYLLARERNMYIEKIEISDDIFYIPEYEPYYMEPTVKPERSVHPRVLINNKDIHKIKENIYKVVIAAIEMSKAKIGALIVLERDIKLKDIKNFSNYIAMHFCIHMKIFLTLMI